MWKKVKPKENRKTVGTTLEPSLILLVDDLIRKGFAETRSDFIRLCVKHSINLFFKTSQKHPNE